jgi:hypothetical protein
MINAVPAESTRSASIWSSRVSTPSTGVTTVRMVGTVTVMYIAVAKTNAAVSIIFVWFSNRMRNFHFEEEPRLCVCVQPPWNLKVKRGTF